MKKIISVALIVAMCATMMLVPTMASAQLNISFSMGNGTANGGLYGRADDEYAVGMVADGDKAQFLVGGSSCDFTDENYAVLDLNVAPNEKTTFISVGPNAEQFTVKSDKFNVNRWNHVRIFVENKTETDIISSGEGQKYTMYINGVKVGEGAQTYDVIDYYKGFRFNLMTTSSNGGSVVGYVADVVLSDGDEITAPVIPVVAAGEEFTVNADKTITFADGAGVTVKDIKDANPDADIRVYWNDKFTSQIIDSYTLTKGNIVVVKKDNIYDYYTVNSGEPTITILAQDSDGSNIGSGKLLSFDNTVDGSGTVEGFGGKATEDKVVKVLSEHADSYIQYAWGTAEAMDTIPDNVLDYDWDKRIGSYTGYLVLEYSVFNVDCPVLQITTDYGGVVVPNFGDSVPKNRWSRVRIVLDRTSTTTNTTYYTVFVDGKQVSAGSSTTLGALYTSGKRACNNIRIGITSSDANTQCTAYVDDVRIYESNGFVGEEPMIAIDNGTNYSVSDSTIIYSNGCEISDIIENINYGANNAKLNLFDAYGNVVADAQSASILGVWGKSATAVKYNYGYNDMYRYYTFTEALQYDLVASTPYLTSNNGTTVDVSEEVFGKTSAELKKVTIGSGNNFHDLFWKVPQPGSRYVVYSVDVAPTEGITSIYFGTNGHARMSLDAKVGQCLNANDWNNIQFVYDINNNTSDLHVNDVCISTGYPTEYVKGESYSIRFIINGATNSYAYIDNLRVYELTSAEKPVNADNAIVHSIVNFEQFGGWSKATASQTEGPDGGDDTAAMIKANNDSGDGDDVYTGLFWDSNLYGFEKYVVYQADVRFGANASRFQIGSTGHERISDIISASNPKLKDGWNRITVVSEADTGINKTYINGIYDHTYESAIHRVDYNNYNTIRIIAYAKDKTDTKTEVISLDNVLVFRTNIEQVYGAPVTGSYSAEVGATFTADCGYGTLLVAAYNGDDMIEAKYINVTADNKTLTLKSEGATEYRAFIWNNINDIKPMYDFIPVTPTN